MKYDFAAIEKKWQDSKTKYSDQPSGENSLDVAFELFRQWRI